MTKKFFNNLLVLILFTCCLGPAAVAQSMRAEAKLQQYTIRIGDQTKLFLSVHQPANEKTNFPRLADTLTGKVLIVRSGKPDTTFDTGDRHWLTVIQSYVITSFDAGTYTIPPFSLGTAKEVLKTNDLTLQVVSVKVDTTKAIYDIKQPLAVSYTFWDWLKDNWYWVVFPLLAIAAITGWWWYRKKHPKDKEPLVQPVVKPGLPIHAIALNKLRELRDKKLWQQDEVKEYHSELSDIIREYLEKRYAIKTHEKTTDEIFAGLKHVSITNENRNKLRQMLVLADLVKFAKEKPLPAENELSMDNAISFVMNTQQSEPQLKKEGGSTDV